ncbi:MAG: hypothetical protein WHV67_06625, partial [Thermoanaerobaculia bacterium]
MRFKYFMLLIILNKFIFSSELSWVSTGGMWTTACVNFCFGPNSNDTSYTRGNGLCLWAHM